MPMLQNRKIAEQGISKYVYQKEVSLLQKRKYLILSPMPRVWAA